MKVTIQQLRYLLKIAELGSITKAAKFYGVSQSAISLVVNQVEKELGFTLFNRSRKGAIPTKDAFDFLARSRRITREMDELEQIYGNASPRILRFAITAMPLVFAGTALDKLAQSEDGKNYTFSMREADIDHVVEDIRTGSSDMGILLLTEQERRKLYGDLDKIGLEYGEVFPTKPYAFFGKNHPLATRDEVTYDDLEPYLRVSMVQTLYTERVIRTSKQSESDDESLSAAHRLVGAEVSLNAESYSIWSLRTPEVVIPDMVAVPIKTTHWLHVGCVVPKGAPLSDIENKYIEAIRKFAG